MQDKDDHGDQRADRRAQLLSGADGPLRGRLRVPPSARGRSAAARSALAGTPRCRCRRGTRSRRSTPPRRPPPANPKQPLAQAFIHGVTAPVLEARMAVYIWSCVRTWMFACTTSHTFGEPVAAHEWPWRTACSRCAAVTVVMLTKAYPLLNFVLRNKRFELRLDQTEQKPSTRRTSTKVGTCSSRSTRSRLGRRGSRTPT